jgi:hypothetical protein
LHSLQVVNAAVLHWLVGLGHGVDGVDGTAILHHGWVGVGEVAHYLRLTPIGGHVDDETHVESGGGWCHGVGVHLDHGGRDDDHHGHEGDGVAHLVVEVGRHAHWHGEDVVVPHGEVVALDL